MLLHGISSILRKSFEKLFSKFFLNIGESFNPKVMNNNGILEMDEKIHENRFIFSSKMAFFLILSAIEPYETNPTQLI